MRGYSKLREQEALKRRRPFHIAGASLIAIGVGWLVWNGSASAVGSAVARWADAQRDPRTYGHRQAEPEAVPAAVPAPAPLPVPESAPVKPVPDPEPPFQVEQARAAAPALEPEKPPAGLRAWYGVVYDLVTLRPITGAKLIFKAGNQEINVATTDGAGHYHVRLEMSHSHWLSVSIAPRQGYLNGLLEDRDPPLRDLPLETRRVIMDDADSSEVGPVPLRFPKGARVVELNLVLVPSVGPSAAALAARPKNIRRVSGMVYDLATLAPVPSAVITFTKDDDQDDVARTMSNNDGYYEASLSKGDGWTVSVAARNRRPGQVFDIDPPYRVYGEDVRREAFESFTDGDLMPAPVEWPGGKSTVRLDLIVLPERWPSAPK